jgi:hypothetical protein
MNVRRLVTGPFRGQPRGSGTWLVRGDIPGGVEIHLFGADGNAAAALSASSIASVELDWRDDGVIVTALADAGVKDFRARNAILHEPCAPLYDALPLVVPSAAAKRFWRRMFLLVRIPGGRHLLRFIARRSRAKG